MNRKRLSAVLAACTALTAIALAAPASAQSTDDLQKQIDTLQQQMNELKAANKKAASGSDIKVKWEPAPKISSADGRFEMNLRGRMLIDAGWVNDSDNLGKIDSTEFRAARLGIEGKAWNNIKYKFEADFAGNEVDITDAYIGYDFGLGELMVGNYKTFNSLEELTSSRFTTFMERGGITDAFGYERQVGVGVQMGGDSWSFGAGVAKGTASSTAGNLGETYSARVTYAPKIGDVLVHMGASYRYRDLGEDEANLRYRQRPHNHMSARFIDTKAFSRKDELFGLELAGVYGPFSVQGEYMNLKATRATAAPGFGKPNFQGYYADASWFITGESRTYKAEDGTFGRVKVKDPVFDGGLGAWQVAVRYDFVDLVDENIFGGEQATWIFGVNWHLNDYTRVMVNYSTSDVKKTAGLASVNGPDGKNNIDAIGVRFQVDW